MHQRDERQQLVRDWVQRAFSPILANPADVKERARRVLEEALELYQSAGGVYTDVAPLAQRTFSRPVGSLEQEAGQVGVTLLALNSLGSIDMLERMEVRNLLSRPASYYTGRMAFKVLTTPQFYDPSEQVVAHKWLQANEPSILKELAE